MNRKDVITLGLVAGITALFSIVISMLIFSTPKRDQKAPVITPISNSMPDIKNDPEYNTIFNDNSLDPTQPIEIGGNQNSTPFKATP